mmetsp:Transcript_34546/g.99133  ORF Transcript_34546/g.99133 Transcript_34546/m.99133 type:complete len:892 (+) Transcript_34546:131-2806(+)
MLDFDELDDLEGASEPPPKSDEERRLDEEARLFKRLLDAEVVAEQRLHQEQVEEGVLGVLLEIEVPQAESIRGAAFFCDAVNAGLRKFRKLLAQKDNGALADVSAYAVRLDALAAMLDALVQHRFYPEAAVWCAYVVEHLSLGKQSFCALAEEWLAPSTKKRRFAECRAAVEAALRRVLVGLRRLVLHAVPWPEPGNAVQQEMYATWFSSMLAVVLPQAPPPLFNRWLYQGLDMPEDDQSEVVLRVHETGEERTIFLPASMSVQEVLQFLKEMFKEERLELLSLPATAQGKPGKLNPNTKVFEAGAALVLRGLREPLPAAQEERARAEAPEEVPGWVAEWRERKSAKVCKTSMVSATRLLWELRSAFIEEGFQERYHALRKEAKQGNQAHREAVEMTFAVQSAVLPKFGFEANPRGVQEMRDEMPIYAGWETWNWPTGHPQEHQFDEVVWKIRRDIHMILDMGQQVPRMPIARPIRPERFDLADRDRWLRHLADEGFVVLASIADEEQVSMAYRLLWDFIEGTDNSGTIARADFSTWGDSEKKGHGWPAGKADGIIHGRGIGQSEVLWFLRTLPRVKQAFADLWGTEHLVTSLDGAGVFRPYGHDPSWRIEKTDQGWCHVDQAHKKRGLHCVQGLVTLKDATEHTGGLVVVPGSHRFFGSDLLKRYEATKDGWNFIALRANDPVLTEGGGGPRLVCAKAGDLLLWDSRTVHCNTLPLKEDDSVLKGEDLVRAVCYVCMTPAAWCSQQVVSKRRDAFGLGVTTSHWPHEHFISTTNAVPSRQFQLSSYQVRLMCPQLASDWCEDNAAQAPPPGRVTFLPASKFVVAQDAPILSSPTTEWGSPIGALKKGQAVEGYTFGPWLHLGEDLPVEGQSSESESGEAWVSMGTLKPAA